MAGPPLDPVTTDDTLPARVDVAIVGGGIIGMSTALALLQKGLSVLVCEKGHVGGEQSSRNWGWCRVSGRDPRGIPLAIEAARVGDDLNEVVEGETGFRKTGILFGCEDDTPDSFRFAYDFLPAFQLEWRSLHLRLDRRFLHEWRDWRVTEPDEVSPFEKVRVLDPDPVAGSATAAQEFFPQFRKAKVAQQWAGLIDATPDALPVISGIDQVFGFFIATGFSGHGFGVGPAAGRLCADLVTGAPPVVDPTPFRFTRFSDGSRPRPLSGV